MKNILLLFGLVFLCNCSRQISLEGVCKNAKAGAIIITDKDSIYFVNGLEFWSKDYYDKKVTLRGKLKVIINEDCSKYDQCAKRQSLILRPKLVILKNGSEPL